jgi:hypothetical protein
MRKHILGQDDTGRIADPGDLEGPVHTGVITAPLGLGKSGRCRGADEEVGV